MSENINYKIDGLKHYIYRGVEIESNFNKININKIFEKNELADVELLVYDLLNCVSFHDSQHCLTYKYKYYQCLFNLIYDIILKGQELSKPIKIYQILLDETSLLEHGDYYLRKILPEIINSNINFNHYLSITSEYGTMSTFMFWLELNEHKIDSYDTYSTIVVNAFTNSDERIYKYLLKTYSDYVEQLKADDNAIKRIIHNLNDKDIIPKKYKLRKIKTLSTYVNLKPYCSHMINTINNDSVLLCIFKYYYENELDFDTIYILIKKLEHKQEVYQMLKTKREQDHYYIINLLLADSVDTTLVMPNINDLYDIIDNNYKKILYMLTNVAFNLSYKNDNFIFSKMIEYIINKKYIYMFLEENLNNVWLYRKLIIYTRFYSPPVINKWSFISSSHNNYFICVNRVLHNLRIFAKRIINKKVNNYKLKFYPIVNEIKEKHINNKKYTNLPPRHLLPYELSNYNNFLLKEKADGILTNNLSLNAYPYNSELYKYNIKMEYMEELDLYFILDIDIPNMNIEERYLYIRNLHPFTKTDAIKEISSLEEFLNEIKLEREILNMFLKINNNIKWYPKVAYKVNNINNNEIINYIENDKGILNCFYNCDGFIITPLNGQREIKVKPKNQLTIDLYYNGYDWLDYENNKWNKIIINTKCIPRKIYRCYPENGLYRPVDIRIDKKKPNNYKIIDTIISIYNSDWFTYKQDNIYYENKKRIVDVYIRNILRNQYNIFINLLKSLKLNKQKNWLDLGCGKCKFFKDIVNEYSPLKYTGIDKDGKYLSSCLNIENPILDLHTFDLSKDWLDTKVKWQSFNMDIKYDYIIANYSIMHFYNDTFWIQLNKIVNKKSLFILNMVKPNMNWSYNDSYLISNDKQTKYKFSWLHDIEKTEMIIDEGLINKYDWKIIKKIEYTDNDLSKLYIWYIIEKN